MVEDVDAVCGVIGERSGMGTGSGVKGSFEWVMGVLRMCEGKGLLKGGVSFPRRGAA